MDKHGDAMSLGEEEIVKDTQFFSEELTASQVPSNKEDRVMYGSSQSASYNQTPYPSYGGMRPPQVNHAQVRVKNNLCNVCPVQSISEESRCPPMSQMPPSHVNAWTNYGGGIGPGVHPVMQMYGSGFFPTFQTPTFSGMSPVYGPVTHSGLADSFLQTQVGHSAGAPVSVEWPNMRNVNVAEHELPHTGSVNADLPKHYEPRPVSTRPAMSQGGQWICPCKKSRPNEAPQQSTAGESSGGDVQVRSGCPLRTGNQSNRLQSGRPSQPSELHQSLRSSSAETQQGPVPSDSIDAEHTLGASRECRTQSHGTPPSRPAVHLRGGLQDSSKSNTPGYLKQRKALRDDEKSYLKEVKLAIAEGRVPQVTVVQDENGNLVRYKSQVLNALKLAAHAVVQDAYIDVNDVETMNEIMDKVMRQFIFRRPLPAGMVEGYLKSYFKRCRLEYHQFWIKYGGKKKPDGCKEAAWLELIEYWNSAEGSQECEKNRINASGEKTKSRKQKSNVECFTENNVEAEVEATGSPSDHSGKSNSLNDNNGTPLTPASPATTRNPMADISNQLHEAVDNILLSFAGRCYSLPKQNLKARDDKARLQSTGSQTVKSSKVSIRTAAEVLESLQRPHLGDNVNRISRSPLPNVEFNSQKVVKTKAKGNDAKNTITAKHEVVQLSSGSSSQGTKVTGIRMPNRNTANDGVTSVKQVYTEDIQRLPRASTDSGTMMNRQGKQPILGKEVSEKKETPNQYLAQRTEDYFVEEDETVPCTAQKEHTSGTSRTILGTLSRKEIAEVNNGSEGLSDEENEQQDDRNVRMDDVSEEEEPPVLPREIVRRKLDVDYGGSSGTKEMKGKARNTSNKPAARKKKGTDINVSILRKLQFYKRLKNSIAYLDEAEGLPNTPVLWCTSHLIEVPPLQQITKLVGRCLEPLSQESPTSDSDFEESRKKREPSSSVQNTKESRRGRLQSLAAAGTQGAKGSRVVLRSADA